MSSRNKNNYLRSIRNLNDRTITYGLIAIIFVVLIILSWYVYNIYKPSNETTNQITNNLSTFLNTNEDNISLIIIVITVIIIIAFILYMIYLNRLQKRDCDYMNSLYPSVDGKLRSINDSNPDYRGNLYDYYIKTAYNACSGGSYKNDYVDICVLKAIIKQGVRCLDFEVYSINDEPVVATSTTNNYRVKETFNSINFRIVMDTIRNFAFSGSTCPNPTDPILIHLRFKSNNQKMYSKLAKIFESNADIMLGPAYSYESKGQNLGKVPLLSLRNKVILIVDRTNNSFLDNSDLLEYINLTSSSIFMRQYDFNKIKNNSDITELTEFNRNRMTIVLPNNGSNPDNPDGQMCRESGCQMVAMRYQLQDKQLMESIQFFDKASYAFVLKPFKLRYIAGQGDAKTKQSRVTVQKTQPPSKRQNKKKK